MVEVEARGVATAAQVVGQRPVGLHLRQRHRVVERAALQETLDHRQGERPGPVGQHLDLPRDPEPALCGAHARSAGKRACGQKVVVRAAAHRSVGNVAASGGVTNEWRYFASSEGSYIEQGTFEITPTFNVSAKVGDVTKTRSFVGVPKTGGWEVAEQSELVESAERIASEAVEMTTA